VAGLLLPVALHQVANVLEVLLGGQPAQWFYPPVKPEQVLAMVFFSIGEEFGWRGYAQPRLTQRHGPVPAALVVGLVWAVWHLTMVISPEDGSVDIVQVGTLLVELPLYSILFAWFLQRSGWSMAVAIALHAGGHLDNALHGPDSEIRLRLLRLLVLVVAAGLAAGSLARKVTPVRRAGG
jgi:membrane protease YdiL (CAAX protease family)